VLAERLHNNVWQRHRAVRGRRLRRGEERLAAGEQDQLLLDAQGLTVEVEAFIDDAEALALS